MNYLEQEKSPYLRQHMDNPVQWRPWGDEAFAAARTEDKPVFLSIGYATCHWCHVMAHESFEDEAVAAQINRDYVPVKVDREERPDVDSVYMAACVAVNGSGGWPLTVLLAPDQTPFWVGTYLPRPALLRLLAEAARLWREDRPALLQTGARLTAYLREAESVQAAQPDAALLHQGAQAFLRSFDRQWGGFQRPPKFPMPHNLVFLLHYGVQERDNDSIRAVTETLEAMHRGGIFDHIGGGFSRYSTDRQWLVPHFEKMLYDNALLLWAYTEGYRLLGRSDFGEVARRTADYVLRELTDPDGGFYCGQDADSEGEEGKYYLLTPEELEPVLGAADAAAFCRWYDITTPGNFEGKSIPNRIGGAGETPVGLEELRRRVLDYRRARLPLGLDDKVLTAWNGLMIAALSRAGQYLSEPRYLDAARRSWDFLAAKLMDSNTTLLARWRDGEAAHPGKLEDYAFLLWGALELYAVCFDTALLAQAVRLGERLLEEFFDPAEGGFYPYAAHGEQLIARRKDPYDGALPSGNAVAALALLRLFRLTGELHWRAAAERQLAYLAGAAQPAPSAHGFALLALQESLAPSTELVCVSAGTEIPTALLNFLREANEPGLSVLLKTPATAEALAQIAPFTADYPIPAAGTLYYFCRNGSCRAPVSEPVLPR